MGALRQAWRDGYLSRERGFRPNTVSSYDWCLGHLEGFLKLPAESITARDVRRYLTESQDSPRTREMCVTAIKSYHRFECLELDRPMNGIMALSGPRSYATQGHHLSAEEARVLLNSIQTPREARLIYLGLYEGLRIAECLDQPALGVLGITLWAEDRLHVFGKGAKPREVPLHPEVASHRFLIQAEYPTDPAALDYAGRRMRQRVGIFFTAHSLRRTFAHRQEEKDVPERIIGANLGHTASITTSYSGTSWDKMVAAVCGVNY